jgi:hypothetical protein
MTGATQQLPWAPRRANHDQTAARRRYWHCATGKPRMPGQAADHVALAPAPVPTWIFVARSGGSLNRPTIRIVLTSRLAASVSPDAIAMRDPTPADSPPNHCRRGPCAYPGRPRPPRCLQPHALELAAGPATSEHRRSVDEPRRLPGRLCRQPAETRPSGRPPAVSRSLGQALLRLRGYLSPDPPAHRA